jgi:hypothetical protein
MLASAVSAAIIGFGTLVYQVGFDNILPERYHKYRKAVNIAGAVPLYATGAAYLWWKLPS